MRFTMWLHTPTQEGSEIFKSRSRKNPCKFVLMCACVFLPPSTLILNFFSRGEEKKVLKEKMRDLMERAESGENL